MWAMDTIEWIDIELTSFCNISCKGCFRVVSKQADKILNKTYIDLDVIKDKFRKEQFPAIKIINFCGSVDEPTTHPQFFEIVEHFAEWDCHINVATNGSIRTPQWWERLAKAMPKSHRVTWGIDGSDELSEVYREGSNFKKVTYLNLVKYETEDQIQAAKQIGSLSYIDNSRIGIWGWSFGGHMSTNCLLKGNNVFKMAIAVAPVTSWRFYDTIYTERFMRTPQENPGGYDDNSPFNYPELLRGDYLLVHGSGDDNVHVQHTMRMVEALIQANKQFDWAIYPDKNHGIYGGNTTMHLYTKMTNFLNDKFLLAVSIINFFDKNFLPKRTG